MVLGHRALLAACAFSLALLFGQPAPTVAQQLPTAQILVIDLNYVMANSTALQGIQERLEQEQSGLEQQMQQREEELREQDQALSRQRTVLSAEAFEERRQQLEQQFAQYQYQFAEQIETMDETYAEAVGQVEFELVRIADELASEHGANMVVPKSTLLLVHEDFDKTSQALERLNQRLPSVSLSR